MILIEDRRSLAADIATAHGAGARLRLACQVAGIDERTLQRWRAHAGLTEGDGRPQAVRPAPGHALSEQERMRMLEVANEPRFCAVPPARIVPMLADEGIYLASESSFARVMRAQGQTAHRGRAKAPHPVRPPTTHIATAVRQVWCWDMTYLPAVVMGRWFHLLSLTAVMEPPMFGVMEPQTVAKTTPRRGLNNGGFCLFFGDGFA